MYCYCAVLLTVVLRVAVLDIYTPMLDSTVLHFYVLLLCCTINFTVILRVAVLDIYIPVLVNLLLDSTLDVNANTRNQIFFHWGKKITIYVYYIYKHKDTAVLEQKIQVDVINV